MNKKKWKVAVVGAGGFAHNFYFSEISKCANAECVAACDINPKQLELTRERFGVEQLYGSVEELLEKCDFDIAIDSASIPAHHELNMAIMAAGKHLISQKPAGLTVDQVTAQIETAKKAGVKFACVPIHSLAPDMKMAKRLMAKGAIGDIISIKCVSAHGGPEYFQYRDADPEWFFHPGAGALYDMGIHAVDKVVSLMGPVKRLTAMSACARKTRMVRSGTFDGKIMKTDILPDTYFITLDFGNDRLGCIDTGFTHVATKCPQMEVYGSHGTISFKFGEVRPNPAVYIDSPDWDLRGWTEPDDGIVQHPGIFRQTCCLTDLVRAIETDTEPELSGVRARHIVEVLCAIEQSAKTNMPVELKTTF